MATNSIKSDALEPTKAEMRNLSVSERALRRLPVFGLPILALVLASVVINSLTTVSWLIEADMNVPMETKMKWNHLLGRAR